MLTFFSFASKQSNKKIIKNGRKTIDVTFEWNASVVYFWVFAVQRMNQKGMSLFAAHLGRLNWFSENYERC